MLSEIQQFRTIIDRLPEAAFLSDMRGRIWFANTAACRLLSHDRETLHGLSMREIDSRTWTKGSEQFIFDRLANPETPAYIDSVYRTASGSDIAVELTVSRITLDEKPYIATFARNPNAFGPPSQHQHFIGGSIENSLNPEKKRHKATIQEADDIIDKSKSIAFVWQNTEGLPVSFVSGNLNKSLGYEPEDFLVRKLKYTAIIHPEDLSRVLEDLRELPGNAKQNIIDHEPYRILTADGKERWVKVSCYVRRDKTGKATHFQGIVEDITNLKQHQDELYRSNILLEKTFQSISDIVLLLDSQFKIIMINKSGRKFLKQPNDEIIGSYCYDFFPGNEYVCDLSQQALDSQSLLSEEVYLERYKKHFIISFAPIFDEEGKVKYIVNVLRDITERKLMEEQLFLAEKMRTIASLAAGVAHEINTPLSAILQSIQIITMGFDMERKENRLQAQKAGIEPDQIMEYIKALELDYFIDGMKKSALNAAKIITNLLNFSRPQKGEVKEAGINELIDNSLELAKADYDLKKKYDIINVKINRKYDQNLPLIACIPMEIEQVFLNLIKNSVHALAGNPPEIVPTITISTFTEHDYVVVHFEDNGPGIHKKILPKIFDPFFTTKEIGIGTGLGLSLSYTIIHDKHSGTITAQSEPGKGTRFVIKFPCIDTIRTP